MLTKKFEVIIFDWDGTLMDSTANITQSIQAACADVQLPVPTKEKAAYVIGLSMTDAFKVACPEALVEDYPKLIAAYQKHYQKNIPFLFDGVLEGLEEIKQKGYFLAVATGKGRNGLDQALALTETNSFFDTTRTVSECFSKPHPQMIDSICDELGVEKNKVLMVGDTTHDLQMAKNARSFAVGVTTGAHTLEQLNSCDHLGLFDSIVEIAGTLPNITG